MAEKIYDLSQLFWPGAAMWPHLVSDIQYGRDSFIGVRSTGWHGLNHPGWFDMGGQPGMSESIPMNPAIHAHGWIGHMHPGTHMDAPIYLMPEGITTDKIPLENAWGTGVIIDMRHKGKWDTITAEDFEKATPKIEAGDFVVVNTGWHEWLSEECRDSIKTYEYYNYYPGLVPSAAEWLIKKKVKAIAGTWPVCDHSLSFAPLKQYMPWVYNDYKRETGGKEPDKEIKGLGGFEECLTMLLKAGITCIQNAGGDINQATGKRYWRFAAWPLRWEETDASMVRLVAIDKE